MNEKAPEPKQKSYKEQLLKKYYIGTYILGGALVSISAWLAIQAVDLYRNPNRDTKREAGITGLVSTIPLVTGGSLIFENIQNKKNKKSKESEKSTKV